MSAKPYLVTHGAQSGVDVLELVGKQYASDPNFALQWFALPDIVRPDNIHRAELNGWQRVRESGVDVTAMGMLLMRKDRRVVDAEKQAVADKGEQNYRDAVAAAGGAITVKTTWTLGPRK